MSDINIKMRHE